MRAVADVVEVELLVRRQARVELPRARVAEHVEVRQHARLLEHGDRRDELRDGVVEEQLLLLVGLEHPERDRLVHRLEEVPEELEPLHHQQRAVGRLALHHLRVGVELGLVAPEQDRDLPVEERAIDLIPEAAAERVARPLQRMGAAAGHRHEPARARRRRLVEALPVLELDLEGLALEVDPTDEGGREPIDRHRVAAIRRPRQIVRRPRRDRLERPRGVVPVHRRRAGPLRAVPERDLVVGPAPGGRRDPRTVQAAPVQIADRRRRALDDHGPIRPDAGFGERLEDQVGVGLDPDRALGLGEADERRAARLEPLRVPLEQVLDGRLSVGELEVGAEREDRVRHRPRVLRIAGVPPHHLLEGPGGRVDLRRRGHGDGAPKLLLGQRPRDLREGAGARIAGRAPTRRRARAGARGEDERGEPGAADAHEPSSASASASSCSFFSASASNFRIRSRSVT